jgi:DNA (cytosine-5)-methyltransferase 1
VNPHAWNLTDLASVKKTGLRVVTTFSCGGGSSMGYKRAGYDVVLANDIDEEMRWHYERNLHPPNYVLAPIRELLTRDLPNEAFEPDILDGSPPCSSFSMVGNREADWGKKKHFREGQATQVLDDLFFDFIDVAARLRPRVVVAENVKGMLVGKAKGYVRRVFDRLRAIGYEPSAYLLNAAMFGVPQSRERVFICAHRKGSSKPKLSFKNTVDKPLTVRDAIDDLQNQPFSDDEKKSVHAAAALSRWWHVTQPGKTYARATRAAGHYKCWGCTRLSFDRPSATLTATDMAMHPSECRHLTFREWKRIGSFPDDYVAKSEQIGKYMVGMSVPPKMMEAVAAAVRDQWLNG